MRSSPAVPGIGKGIAARIREYLDTGSIAKVVELRAQFPPAMVELTRIPGMGPKTIRLLHTHLGIDSLEALQAALDAGQDPRRPRTRRQDRGQPPARRSAASGSTARSGGPRSPKPCRSQSRWPPLSPASPGSWRRVPCGSIRRLAETIGDADVVVATKDPEPVMERFVSMGLVTEVLARGETKTSILSTTGLQVDLRVVRPEQLGAALVYFTGSKAHNIDLRQRAIDRGLILNEYSLAVVETEEVVASATEEDVYAALDLPWIPPPMREHSGEILAAARSELPDLVQLEDIMGDLHDHTHLSGDGRASLEVMVEAAAKPRAPLPGDHRSRRGPPHKRRNQGAVVGTAEADPEAAGELPRPATCSTGASSTSAPMVGSTTTPTSSSVSIGVSPASTPTSTCR